MMHEKVVEILPMQAMKLSIQAMKLPMQAMKLLAPRTPPPQDQMILMSIALVRLRSLPSVFVYFLYITLLRLKIKNKPTKKRINHRNDVICFTKIYNK